MADLQHATIGTVNGKEISAAEALRSMKLSNRLWALESSLEDMVVEERAKQQGLTVEAGELQTAADDFRRQRGLHSAAATEKWLEEARLSLEDFEQMLERQLLREKLKAQAIPDDAVERHFAENRQMYESAELSQFHVGTRGKAEELLAQINDEGADFAELASQHASDDAARSNGGRVGQVNRKALSPEVEGVVFGAKAGEVVGPLETDQGWCLIKVWSLHQPTLDAAMTQRIREQLFREWLNENAREAISLDLPA